MTNLTTENTLKKAPFKADHVGSFLRPERLKKARLQKENGEITAEQLRKIEDEEIIKLVENKKKPDLKVVTDGELRRKWWHFDFLSGFDGVELYRNRKRRRIQRRQTESRWHSK